MEQTQAPAKITPVKATTQRGFATSSLCLGLWASLTFWWYPFGLIVGSIAAAFAVISIVMGYRAGKDGEHLAWVGLFFGGNAAGMAIVCYRFMQMAFEGSIPSMLP